MHIGRKSIPRQNESRLEPDRFLPLCGDIHRADAGPSGGQPPAMATVLQESLPGDAEQTSADLFLSAAVRVGPVPAGGHPGDAKVLARR